MVHGYLRTSLKIQVNVLTYTDLWDGGTPACVPGAILYDDVTVHSPLTSGGLSGL